MDFIPIVETGVEHGLSISESCTDLDSIDFSLTGDSWGREYSLPWLTIANILLLWGIWNVARLERSSIVGELAPDTTVLVANWDGPLVDMAVE